MRFAVVGIGGIGGYYAGVLGRVGHEVQAFARGDTLRALRERGIEVRTPEHAFTAPLPATDEIGGLAPADVVLVTVKSYAIHAVAPAVRVLAEGGAVVVPLLNGVDAVERLARAGVPAAQLLGGVTYISAARVAPGIVERRSPFQRVLLGDPGGGPSPRAERIAAAFREAGVDARAVADIALALWQKYVFIVAMAAACGLARSAIGPLRDTPLGRRLLERAVREAAAVGRARGVALPPDEEARTLAFMDGLPAAMTPSFVLDVERGAATELDVLSGALAAMAAEAGVETPVHDTAAAALAVPRGP